MFEQSGLAAVTVAPPAPTQSGISDLHCDGVIEIRLGKSTVRIKGRSDPAKLAVVLEGLRG